MNVKISLKDFGGSSQLTNCVLESDVMYNMTPEIPNFLPGSLLETDKYIEVINENFITSKQTEVVQINMHDDNGKPFIETLYNALFAPDL